jgi:PhoH-like ATPase
MTKYANVPDNGTSGKQPKIFVLDTNIILHDFKAIRHFQDNDLVIPMAVIEELDKFKKGNDTLSFNARGFMREINKLTDGKMFGKSGVPIGHGLGFIKIEPNHPFSEQFKDLFHDDIQDHRILATAMWVRDNNPGRFVALVTKDINLRLKAKAAGMEVQDYLSDRIEDNHVEGAEREVEIIDNLSPNILQKTSLRTGHSHQLEGSFPEGAESETNSTNSNGTSRMELLLYVQDMTAPEDRLSL